MSTLTINSNVASLSAQRRLAQSTKSLEGTFQRLSSGLRINRASDDASGLAIASGLSADRKVLTQGIRNFNDGIALLNVAEGAMEQLGGIVTRISELAEQAKNGTVTLIQRRALNQEAFALTKEFNRIVHATKYNDLSLLDGSIDTLSLQAGYGSDGKISLELGSPAGSSVSNGTYGAEHYIDLTASGGFELAGVNADSYIDYITYDSSGGTVGYHLGNGDGTFLAPVSIAVGFNPASVSSSDFDNDGFSDILVENPGHSGFRVMLSNGNGTFRMGVSIGTIAVSSSEMEDISGDGLADLIVIGGSNTAQVFISKGDGTFKTPTTFNFEISTPSGEQTFFDMDADGNQDLFLIDSSTNVAKLYYGNGDGTFSRGQIIQSTVPLDRIVAGDINNDGLGDLIYNAIGGGSLKVQYGQLDRKFSAESTFVNGTSYLLPSLNDANADGLTDLVYSDLNAPGELYLRLGNGDGTFAAINTINDHGAGLDIGLFVDFSGDGVPDVAGISFVDLQVAIKIAGTKQDSVLPYFNLLTKSKAGEALDTTRLLLDFVGEARGKIGSFQARLATGVSNLQQNTENLATAESRIRDADIGEESAALVRTRILQQAGVAVLAQANTLPELALTLLSRG